MFFLCLVVGGLSLGVGVVPDFDEQVREELARRHDGLLSLSMLNRKERRRRGVRVQKREIERMLFATGLVIAQDKL